MGSTTVANTKMYISAGTPATNDLAGYAALTYTEIGLIEQIGPIGPTYQSVEFVPLSGPTEKHKGSVNYGAASPSLAHDPDDAGQELLRTAAADRTSKLYAFKVEDPDGSVEYFGGRVFGYPKNRGNANSILMANPTVEISTEVYA